MRSDPIARQGDDEGCRHDEAMRVVARAREVDPLSALDYAMSSQVAFQAREYATALEFARRAVAIDPDFWVGHMMSGQAYDLLGNPDLALEAATVAGVSRAAIASRCRCAAISWQGLGDGTKHATCSPCLRKSQDTDMCLPMRRRSFTPD